VTGQCHCTCEYPPRDQSHAELGTDLTLDRSVAILQWKEWQLEHDQRPAFASRLSKQTTQVGGKSLYRSSAEQVVPTQFDQDHTSAGWESAGLQYAIRQVRSWSRQVVHGSSDSIGEESRPRVLTAAESRRQGVANYEHRLILGCGSRARWVLLYDHRGHQGEDHQQRPRGRATNLGRTLKTREPRSDCGLPAGLPVSPCQLRERHALGFRFTWKHPTMMMSSDVTR
jgi:hypothetical protein